MNIPKDLYYSKEHEWIRVEGDVAYMGITDYAQDHLGDIVFVELPELEQEFAAMEEIGVIESVKAVSPMYSPVGGSVSVVNEALEAEPELINQDCYENYICAVKMTDLGDLGGLMQADAYTAFCEAEEQGGK